MAEPPPASMVGRDTSLRELRSALERATDGSPSVVLVTGETGVGKTRLVRALVEDADPVLLYGSCVPVAGEPLPFAPLTQALRRLGANGVLRSQLERSPDLARLVPGLAGVGALGQAGAGAVRPDGTDPVAAGQESSRLLLFQSVLSLVERLGATGPVLLVVEDVHWADRSTLDLVRYLATNLATERVVLLVTYRDDAVPADTPLAAWLAELGRLEVTRRVHLDRLDPDETATLVARLTGGEAGPELLASTYARSAGNPLFVEHLLLAAGNAPGAGDRPGAGNAPGTGNAPVTGDPSGSGTALPGTLHDLIVSRVSGLPDDTSRLLRGAAVLGRPSSIPLLAATIGSTEEGVESALRPALAQHVLEVRPDGAVRFRHPAFGEVVYAELLPSERARLHRSAAEALDALVGEERSATGPEAGESLAGELARHWLGAGDRERALDAAVAAGRAAERMYAFADAHDNYARALELAGPDGSGHDRVRLLTQAARAASLVGDHDEAVRLATQAFHLTTEPAGRAALAALLGDFQYVAGRGSEAGAWFLRAKEEIPEDEVSLVAAQVHASLALFTATWSRLDEATEHCTKGARLARAVGARREEGIIHNARGVIALARGDEDEAVEQLRLALDTARAVGTPTDLAGAYVNLSHVLVGTGRLDELVRLCEEGQVALARVGLAGQIGGLLVANTSEGLIDAGRYPDAQRLLHEALAHRPRGIAAAPLLLQAGRLATVHGDLEVAWERCEQARLVVEAENAPDAWVRLVTEGAAEVELWAGRPRAAYDLAMDCLRLVAGSDEEAFAGQLVGIGLRALADEAEKHRDAASRRERDERLAPLAEVRGRLVADGQLDEPTDTWQRAETGRLALGSDADTWSRAAGLWQEAGRPFPAAYALWRRAEALLDAGAGSAAVAATREAHAAASTLGARRLAEEVERLAGWHRVDLLPPLSEVPESRLDAYRLTAREEEVLAGLAAGRTNQEIADELFISVKTASVHVSNILRKLDVSGRQEAARVAHRLGVRG